MSSDDDSKRLSSQLALQISRNTRFLLDLQSDWIVTSAAKLEQAAESYVKQVASTATWASPFGVVVALSIALATSEFRNRWISADAWQTIHVIALLGALAWLGWAVVRTRRSPTPKGFIVSIVADRPRLEQVVSGDTDAVDRLVSGRWTLVYDARDPLRHSKFITFNPDGTVGEGKNHNEATWSYADGVLQFNRSNGDWLSRFVLSEDTSKWEQTRESFRQGVSGQYIVAGRLRIGE